MFPDPKETIKLGRSCTVVPETVIVTVVLCVGNVPDTVTVLDDPPELEILAETLPPVSPLSETLADVIILFELAVNTLVCVVNEAPGVPVSNHCVVFKVAPETLSTNNIVIEF